MKIFITQKTGKKLQSDIKNIMSNSEVIKEKHAKIQFGGAVNKVKAV